MDEDDVGLTSSQHKHSKGIKLTQVKEYVATLSSKELRISQEYSQCIKVFDKSDKSYSWKCDVTDAHQSLTSQTEWHYKTRCHKHWGIDTFFGAGKWASADIRIGIMWSTSETRHGQTQIKFKITNSKQ